MQWFDVIIPIHPFLLDISSHVLRQPAHARRDLGGKSSGTRVYCLSLRFSQFTLDDSGRNRGRPSPTVWATCPQLVPTQGCQKLSCTGCKTCVVAAAWSTSVPLHHDAHGHQLKGMAVLWKWYCQGVRWHSQVLLRYSSPPMWDVTINQG